MIVSALDNTRWTLAAGRVPGSKTEELRQAESGMGKVIMKDLVLMASEIAGKIFYRLP